jgi:hypothetical protein
VSSPEKSATNTMVTLSYMLYASWFKERKVGGRKKKLP